MIQNDHNASLWDCPDIHPATALESPELVAVERRRRLLTYLQHELGSEPGAESESDPDPKPKSTTVDELVDALCDDGISVESTNGDTDRTRDATADRHNLRIYLHHTDLPILEKAGLIEYDVERQRVEIVR